MATTKRAASSTKAKKPTASARKKPAAAKSSTKVTRVSAKSAPTSSVAATASTPKASRLDNNIPNIVVAELVGTFVLTLVALLTFANVMPLYVGLTLVVLVMALGAVSGSHVNPAVTFGLWAAGKLKPLLVPFYWAAQILGAMGAFVLLNVLSGNKLSLDFGHFNHFNWNVFSVEMVGTAVFVFGLVAVLSRVDLTAVGKALGIGLSLTVGLLVAGSLFATVQGGVDQSEIGYEADEETGTQRLTNVPHELRVKGATLNPAVALAVTENTDSQLQGGRSADNEKLYTRFGWEVILSTLIGAAVGGNLVRVISYRFRS